MNVLVVEPGFAPYEKEIEEKLEAEQAIVGGYIDVIYPYKEQVGIVCNDEGLINGLPFNRSVEGGYGGIFGTFFVCGLSEDNFCSLTPEQMERYKQKFYKAEILVAAIGDKVITMKVEPKLKEQPGHPQRPSKSPER